MVAIKPARKRVQPCRGFAKHEIEYRLSIQVSKSLLPRDGGDLPWRRRREQMACMRVVRSAKHHVHVNSASIVRFRRRRHNQPFTSFR
jgi:hypothetical protein